jgi:hypothetical protein
MIKTYLMPIIKEEQTVNGEILMVEKVDLGQAKVKYQAIMNSDDDTIARVIIDTDEANHEIISGLKDVKSVEEMSSADKINTEKKFKVTNCLTTNLSNYVNRIINKK